MRLGSDKAGDKSIGSNRLGIKTLSAIGRAMAGNPRTEQIVSIENQSRGHRFAFVALLIGNVALAAGPFLVRHSGVGPVAAGFWRMALAIPFLFLIARMVGQPVHWPRKGVVIAVAWAAL